MAERRALRVLVVDDEPLGVERVVELLEEQPAAEVVGTAGDGASAVAAIRELRPDLVFLDVQMPRGTGLDVVREVGPRAMPAVVFVTAFDRFALHAFDAAAVDYLVKPFDDERFEEAFARARRRVELEELGRLGERMLALLQGAAPGPEAAPAAPAPRHLERIAVHQRGRLRVVPVEEIDYIAADGPYAELHCGRERHLVREALHVLEVQLDPARWVRIHRSTLVQLDRVQALLRGSAGDYEVELRTGARLRVSRSQREALERRLGRV